jgi:transposase, IS5 family
MVPWECFRADIAAAVLTPAAPKKSSAGRKPIDVLVLFRMLILQALHNLSDEQTELGFEDSIPDATTLWLFREKLAQAGLIESLFDRFEGHLAAKGYTARSGQMIDATIVPVPKQHNRRDENEMVKAGETPPEWTQQPAKPR